MDHLKRRSICKSCRVCFVRDNDTQVYCHSCLMDAHYKAHGLQVDGDKKKKKCLVCGIWFFPKRGATCSEQCKEELKKSNHRDWREKEANRKAEKENLSVEAKRWIENKERTYTNNLPYSELNKLSEHARVFGKYSDAPLYFKRKGYGR